jgi:hypothetical protein
VASNAVAAVTGEITAVTEEMAAGTAQVTTDVRRIANTSQASAAATGEVSSTLAELSAAAHRTTECAWQFSCSPGRCSGSRSAKEPPNQAKTKARCHLLWTEPFVCGGGAVRAMISTDGGQGRAAARALATYAMLARSN